MSAWIGPAIVAAVISPISGAIGWYATDRTTIQLDKVRRRDKVRDVQIALRAAIRSEWNDLRKQDTKRQLTIVRSRYDETAGYAIFGPTPARHVVYGTYVSDVHIRPSRVIDPVVLYDRQRDTIERLVENVRKTTVAQGDRERQFEMYEDYLNLRNRLKDFAETALTEIELSLSCLAAVPSARRSAAAGSAPGGSACPW